MKKERSAHSVWWLFVVLLVASLGLIGPLAGSAHADEDSAGVPADLELALRIFEDPSRRLSLADIAFGDAAPDFRPVGPHYNGAYDYTGHVWARFELPAIGAGEEAARYLALSSSHLDDVLIYLALVPDPESAADFSSATLGTRYPYLDRPVPDPRLFLPVELKPWPQQVILRYLTHTTNALSVSLIDQNSFLASSHQFWLLNGGFLSVCLLIAVINFAFWYWLREGYYLSYAAFSLSQIPYSLWQTSMIFSLAPRSAHLIDQPLLGASAFLISASGFLFAIQFLNLRQSSRLAYWLVMGVILGVAPLDFVIALLGVWNIYYTPLALIGLLLSLYPLVHVIGRAFAGDLRAQLYLLSFTPINLALLLTIARNLNLIPAFPWISGSMETGGVMHLLLMTLALGYRIRRAESERRRAEQHALDLALSSNQRAQELVEQRTGELVAAKRATEEALEAERLSSRQQLQFIDMVSHEYRTPVAVLRTNLDLLNIAARKGKDTPKIAMTRMAGAIDRLTEIIEVGLRRDRVATNRFSPVRVPVRLDQLLGDAIDAVTHMHPERRIVVEMPEDTSGFEMTGDMAMLKTCVVNILDNALKYSSPETQVRAVLSDPGDGGAQIEIIDQGGGIAEKDRQHVFDKYYRSSDISAQPGAGIGLYLVETIVKAHQGTISLDSVGAGTVARLWLPLQPMSAHRPPANNLIEENRGDAEV